MLETLKAPFPYFGGKSKVSSEVWQRFGNVPNYVEPFAGSLAVLLNRPHPARTETVNDIDTMVSNFWRALASDPDQVAHFADWPVNEADLEARHIWLVNQSEFREKMKSDPDFYDCKIAGWWAWGLSAWIGSGWCDYSKGQSKKRPHLGNAGKGINRKLPHLGNAGQGINRRGQQLQAYFANLASRLRSVRVACGDWERVVTDAVTTNHGLTAVFLDPPYDIKANRRSKVYNNETLVSGSVRLWAIENGSNPLLRIALCGYEGEHDIPDDWEAFAWKAQGGYGSGSSIGSINSSKEKIWFSPHCLKVSKQSSIFDILTC